MSKRKTPWLRVRVPAVIPAFVEVEEGTFADSAKATTAQWRIAASRLQQASLSEIDRDLVLRPVCQMVSISIALPTEPRTPAVPTVYAIRT
jgi:hypothetical protein